MTNSINSIINPSFFMAEMKEKLNQDMLAAAEPLIQEALASIEKELRNSLAANLVAMANRAVEFDMCRNSENINIRVRLDRG